MVTDILVPLIVVGIAELGDKSQLALLLLSTRTKNHLALLLGALLGFFIIDGVAIVLGGTVLKYVPKEVMTTLAALLFIGMGIYILLQKEEKKKSPTTPHSPFLSGLTIILIFEWGDKTQIASALLAANYNGWLVFLGVMIAMTILCTTAIYVGKYIAKLADSNLIQKVAGITFIALGLTFLVNLYFS